MTTARLIKLVLGLALLAGGMYIVWLWVFCRVYVRPGECAVIVHKSGKTLHSGQTIAESGQKGIQRLTLGPGRYFLNPFMWEIERSELVTISAGDPETWEEVYQSGVPDYSAPELSGKWPQVGIVTSLAGKPWTGSSEIVDAGFQGKQRDVLTPGVYRINPRAFRIETVPAVIVPVGCGGVVTSQLGDMPGTETVTASIIGPDGKPQPGRTTVVQKLAEPGQRGVLKNVLPPGIYYLNPYVYKVRVIQVGYNLITSQLIMQQTQAIANPMQQQQAPQKSSKFDNLALQQLQANAFDSRMQTIEFPSKDGFTVGVEVTVVWGRHPLHTPEMINRLGDVEKIRELVVAQTRSICRNIGSEYLSTDFIEGSKREQYQRAVTETLKKVCQERNLEILIALIHNIEVHTRGDDTTDLKQTIQMGFIAREQDLTRQEQRETAIVKAELETATAGIAIARQEVTADTNKKVAEIEATAQRKAAEIDAQRDLEVAQVERQIAEIEAEQRRVLGAALAQVERLKNEAGAAGKRLMIEAFGSGSAYNLYTFSQNFSPESVRLIFAGEGTFWTDLSKVQDAASLQLLKDK